MQQLQWAGEQSAMFGSDVTYSYYAFLDANNLPNALPQDVGYLEMQGCLRLPTNMLLDDFVKQYFLHVHPMLPIINEGDFWEVYGSPPEESTRSTRISLLLFQAMLFAACPVSTFGGLEDMVAPTDDWLVRATQSHQSLGLSQHEGDQSRLVPPS